jgi:hypothetical protein
MPKRKRRSDGESRPPLPPPSQTSAQRERIHISVALHRAVKLLAVHKGVRANNLWLTAMDEYLKREDLPGFNKGRA